MQKCKALTPILCDFVGDNSIFSVFLQTITNQHFPRMDTKSLIQTKKPYAKPRMLAECFVANAYCVTCSSNIYKVGEEYVNHSTNGITIQGQAFYETNHIEGLQIGDGGDQSVGGFTVDPPQNRIYDGCFYFENSTLKEGYVKSGETVWHVYLFNPLTWEEWDQSWHMYDSGTFLSAENRDVIVSAGS